VARTVRPLDPAEAPIGLAGAPPPEATAAGLVRLADAVASLNSAMLAVATGLRADFERLQSELDAREAEPRYYSAEQVAAILQVDPDTVRAKAHSGEIPAWISGRIIRISAEALAGLGRPARVRPTT
jgi:excisionase family DNA binding protein